MNNGFPYNEEDQLSLILQKIGSASDTTGFEFISGEKSKKYAQSLPEGRNCLKDLFDYVDEQGFDLLQGLLKLNPDHRLSLEECLSHQYFEGLREDDQKEELAFDKINQKFEYFWHDDMPKKDIREYFLEEFSLFHQDSC